MTTQPTPMSPPVAGKAWLLRCTDLFFAKAEPLDLAMLRIIVYGHLFRLSPSANWGPYRESLYEPVGIFKLLPFPPTELLEWLFRAWPVATALAALGLGFRPAAIFVAAVAPYVLGFGNNFIKVDHSANLLTLLTITLAFSRAADGVSLASWWRERSGKQPPAPSGLYRWPVRMAWLLVASMYFSAGISKLHASGWEWAFSDNFQNLLVRHHFTHSPPTHLGLWFAQYPTLCRGMAFGALLLELAAPLMMLGGLFTLVVGGGLASLQFGIYLTLGVPFPKMIPVFLALVPWSYLRDRLAALRAGVPRPPEPPADGAATT